MKKEIDILNGNLYRDIFIFSLPLVLSNVIQVLFNLADIAVVGKFAGPLALGSVGSTSLLTTLFVTFIIGVSSGANVFGARYIGMKDEEKVKINMFNAFLVALFFGVAVLLFGECFASIILKIMKTKEELLAGALMYLRIFFLGMPGLSLYNYGNALYSADGNTRKPLIFLSISGIVNIILNLLFVIVLKMSVMGVALATIISQWLSAIMILSSLRKTDKAYRFTLNKELYDLKSIKEIISIGVPTGLQNALFFVANLFVQAAVNTFPVAVVEGNSASLNADNLVYDVMAAFYVAGTTFISQNLGVWNRERIRKSYLISMFYAFAIGSLMGVTLVIFGKQFLLIFTSEEEVIMTGLERLKIMGLSYGFSAFMDGTIAASRGLGKTKTPMYIVFLGSVVFRVIWIFTIFAYFKTITSIYMLYIFSWTITASFEIIYFSNAYKQMFD